MPHVTWASCCARSESLAGPGTHRHAQLRSNTILLWRPGKAGEMRVFRALCLSGFSLLVVVGAGCSRLGGRDKSSAAIGPAGGSVRLPLIEGELIVEVP